MLSESTHRPVAVRLGLLLTGGALSLGVLFLGACSAPRSAAGTVPESSALEVSVIGDGTASLRGLSAVSSDVAWATGSGATVARTTDGGRTWVELAPDSIEGLDVRDVHALSAETAWILSAGTGEASRILHTADGGATWTEQHRETDPAAFLDGFAFLSPLRAIAYGDPLPGVGFRILITEDGGRTWTAAERGPTPMGGGEASFAASGTGVIARAVGARGQTFERAWIVTGASDALARVFRTSNLGLAQGGPPTEPLGTTWLVSDTTMPAPKPAAGAFSIALTEEGTGVVVGGDYTAREVGGVDCASWTEDLGITWHAPTVGPRGQRAGCAALGGGVFVATGQTGTDVTVDGGRTWSALFTEGFHCVEAAAQGAGTVWFAGPNGRVGRLDWPRP